MKRILFITAFAFSFLNSFAQQDTITMEGTLSLTKSDTYKYKLVVGLSEGKWKGYSVLDAGGPNETSSTVSVQFSKEKKSLMFAEKTLIATKSKESNFCFVGGGLKMNDKKNGLKGFFVGQDNKKSICGTGTIKLNLPEAAKVLMTPDGTKDTNTNNVKLLTGFRSETFKVNNPEVQLEIWDGGVNDHDSLSISLNGVTIMPGFEIVTDKKIITLKLKKGENVLKINALNEGLEAPNSARIAIIDQNNKFALVSFLKDKQEATVKIKL